MESLFNALSGWTNREIAMAIFMLVLLTVFLVPMYLIHCTGRNLIQPACGLVANREWLLSKHVIQYRRYETKAQAKEHKRRWSKSLFLRIGSMSIEVHTLSPSVRGVYKKAYSKLKHLEKQKV